MDITFRPPRRVARWKWLLGFWAAVALATLIAFLTTWNTFFQYVPPGQHLVIIAKDGAPLPAGHVLAKPGEKGPLEEVMGEGWHFVMPIAYERKLEANTTIAAGKVGVLTALGGEPLPAGRVLADKGEQGIQRRVLPPGSYRINLHGYKVEEKPATEIPVGFVGVQRRLVGRETEDAVIDADPAVAGAEDRKGFLSTVLQPGLYYINPYENDVIPSEVGIFQTTFAKDDATNRLQVADNQLRTPITFTSRGGFPISVDCTVEWEVLPEDMPRLVAEYGTRSRIEENVIDLQTHAIGRDKGSEYGVLDLLEGVKRTKFQEDFTKELVLACAEKNVTVHSAFIRSIDIPEEYLKQIRDKQIATQRTLTNKAKEATAKTHAEVEEAKQMVELEVKKVEAETKRLVGVIDSQVENLSATTEGELERMRAVTQAEVAILEGQRDRLTGEAAAEGEKLKETARSSLAKLKMDVFQGDGQSFLRYALSENLSPDLRLRLFQSGPGTFWTNMPGNEGMNLLLQPNQAPGSKPPKKTEEAFGVPQTAPARRPGFPVPDASAR
ncbi:MAG: hypothetical protein FJ309_16775 [Planctomycetes bacterium]|nr:hypothetical protein [Planctomycetota bacterium]